MIEDVQATDVSPHEQEQDNDYTFYLVWSPQGPTPPKARYAFLSEARCNAGKMKKKYPDQDFYILKAKRKAHSGGRFSRMLYRPPASPEMAERLAQRQKENADLHALFAKRKRRHQLQGGATCVCMDCEMSVALDAALSYFEKGMQAAVS